MIEANAGAEFLTLLEGAPPNLGTALGLAIMDLDSQVIEPRSTADIGEVPPGSGDYWGKRTAPAAGDYILVWDDGATTVTELLKVHAVAAVQTGITTPIGWLRKLLEDDPAAEYEASTADGEQIDFYAANPPMSGDVTVRLNAGAQSTPADYLVSEDARYIRFNVAPAADARVELTYFRQMWPNEELQHYLDQAALEWDEDRFRVYQAGIYAIDSLMMGAATGLNFTEGRQNFDIVSVWDRLQRLREILETYLETAGAAPALIIADMVFDTDNPEWPGDWQNLGNDIP